MTRRSAALLRSLDHATSHPARTKLGDPYPRRGCVPFLREGGRMEIPKYHPFRPANAPESAEATPARKFPLLLALESPEGVAHIVDVKPVAPAAQRFPPFPLPYARWNTLLICAALAASLGTLRFGRTNIQRFPRYPDLLFSCIDRTSINFILVTTAGVR